MSNPKLSISTSYSEDLEGLWNRTIIHGKRILQLISLITTILISIVKSQPALDAQVNLLAKSEETEDVHCETGEMETKMYKLFNLNHKILLWVFHILVRTANAVYAIVPCIFSLLTPESTHATSSSAKRRETPSHHHPTLVNNDTLHSEISLAVATSGKCFEF